MAKIPQTFVRNDIICLVNPAEIIIGKFVELLADGTVQVMDPSNIVTRQTPNGLSVGFMDYNEGKFITKRNQRNFDPANFISVDIASSEIAEHYKSAMSPIKAPPKSKLIGI